MSTNYAYAPTKLYLLILASSNIPIWSNWSNLEKELSIKSNYCLFFTPIIRLQSNGKNKFFCKNYLDYLKLFILKQNSGP